MWGFPCHAMSPAKKNNEKLSKGSSLRRYIDVMALAGVTLDKTKICLQLLRATETRSEPLDRWQGKLMKGIQTNLDLILSWSDSAGNGGTGGLPYIVGMTSIALFGDIEGVNGYCSQLGSMAFGSWLNSFWVRFCWEWGHRRVPIYSWGDYWGHWRCQHILFPPGFSGIWHFPTIGLELNFDLILSGSGTAGVWYFSSIGLESNIAFILFEGVKRYWFHRGSVAYRTSPPLAWN